jgi:hypothetical protein
MTAHTVTRNRFGDLKVETRIPLGSDNRELRISTDKTQGYGVICRAMVVTVHADHFTHAYGLAGGGDWSRRLAQEPKMRATEKNLVALHERCTADEATLLAEARAHYATVGA